MEHFAGLDVSVNETSVCIVDETGKVVREVKVASEPEQKAPDFKIGFAAYHCVPRTEEVQVDDADRKKQFDRFLHYANLERFRKQLADTSDEVKRQTLLKLLDAEEANSPLQPKAA